MKAGRVRGTRPQRPVSPDGPPADATGGHRKPRWSLGDPAFGVPPDTPSGQTNPCALDDGELAARREDILDYLRGSFRYALEEDDLEDVVQATWVALLARTDREPIRDLRAYVTEVAWRQANQLIRRPGADLVDPEASELMGVPSPEPSLDERMDTRARIARLAEALAQLGEPEREVLRLWFVEELPHDLAVERLGISRSAYFKRLRLAKDRIEGAMELECDRFSRRQRRLLSDYVAGIATERARARAERLIASDPQAAALAHELRRTHRAAAITLPALFAADTTDGSLAGRLERVADTLRDAIVAATGRSPGPAEIANSPVLASGGARGAGAAGVGLLAKALGGVGASNVALGCLGGGAVATVACVVTGVLPLPGRDGGHESAAKQTVERQVAAPESGRSLGVAGLVARESARPPVRPSASEGSGGQDRASAERTQRSDDSGPTASPVATTAPPVEQEFGVASAATPVSGAPPDTNDSNGAAASTVRGEFGP